MSLPPPEAEALMPPETTEPQQAEPKQPTYEERREIEIEKWMTAPIMPTPSLLPGLSSRDDANRFTVSDEAETPNPTPPTLPKEVEDLYNKNKQGASELPYSSAKNLIIKNPDLSEKDKQDLLKQLEEHRPKEVLSKDQLGEIIKVSGMNRGERLNYIENNKGARAAKYGELLNNIYNLQNK
jgi:hypothetical protein